MEANQDANLDTGPGASVRSPEAYTGEARPPSGKRLGRWRGLGVPRSAALAFTALALVLLPLGLCYHLITIRADARRFPQEGKSVNVGGFNLNLNCTGQGSPIVILEAGLGVPAISWRAVQSEITGFTRVCSYDRAGYDWSDPGPMPRTSARSAAELHTLLRDAGEKPPFVLVGHSFGGTNVRVYNGLFPDDVAGIVLADTGQEDLKLPDYFQQLRSNELEQRRRDRKWARLRYWLGISRLEAAQYIDDPALPYNRQEWFYFLIQPGFIAAAASELENRGASTEQLRRSGTLGDKPLIVLIARDSLLDLPLPPENKYALNQMWVESEKRLAGLSSRGKWVMVSGTGHMIPFDRPDAIVDAVRELSVEARKHEQSAFHNQRSNRPLGP